ncbi:hypothetical protein BC628DRAFT_77733 [Trametes gibbosa]|nr:hypothetical protein BC628DRAFT_77733 [Trametes gibbosa]
MRVYNRDAPPARPPQKCQQSSFATSCEYFVCTNEHYKPTVRNTHWNPFRKDNSKFNRRERMVAPESPTVSATDVQHLCDADMPAEPPTPARSVQLAQRVCAIAAVSPQRPRPPEATAKARAPNVPRPKKAATRRIEEKAKAKGAVERAPARAKRTKRATPEPMGPRTCRWAGCGRRVDDGRDIWAHILAVHGGGREDVAEKHVPRSCGGLKAGCRVSRPDGAGLESGGGIDVECEPAVELDAEGEGEEDAEKGALAATATATHWFDKVRCGWDGCSSQIQYLGLRRHVESKHVPLRGAQCPHGCGFWMNRADMLWRHVERCDYVSKEANWEEEGAFSENEEP